MKSDVSPAPAPSAVLATDTDTDTSILAPRYRAATVGMVALVSLGAFEALAVAAAMPTVARELDGLRLYALAFGGTLATSVVGMTLAGHWSDRAGPTRPLWLGLGCFVAGLLLAGLAPNMGALIAGRLLQGLGAGAYSVVLYVIVARLYPEALQPRVFAAFSAGWVVPSLLGPGLSGLIVQHVGWRWVFLAVPALAVPAGLLLRPVLSRVSARPAAGTMPAPAGAPCEGGVDAAAPAARLARAPDAGADRGSASRPAAAPGRVPWALGAAAGVLMLYLGGQLHGMRAPLLMLPGLALLAVCAWRLLPAGTLRLARGLPSVIALRGIAASAFFGCEAFLPLLLSRERGLSALLAGAALSVGALGWFSGSWYQGHHGARWSRPQLLTTGAALMIAGIAVTAGAALGAPVPLAIAGWAVAGLGMGLLYPSLSVLTLALSPPQQQGSNSSALQFSEAIAVATTLAIGGSLFALLLTHGPRGAYLATFAVSLLLALVALAVARRI